MGIELSTDEFTRCDWKQASLDDDVRFAIVGLGGFARNSVLPALEAADHCVPTVLVSSDQEKAGQLNATLDADRTLTYDEFTNGDATDAYDAVYVATPNARHLPFIEAAARHGKHVIVEKPLESSVKRAQQAVDACTQEDVHLMVGYRMQIDPMMRGVRRLLQDGYIGRPVQIRGSFSYTLTNPDHWRVDPELSGGGALMDVGIYPVNTARFLLDAEPVTVQGTTSPADTADGIDRHVTAHLTFDDEVTAICTASHGAYRENRLTVVGSEGVIAVDPAFDVTVKRTLDIRRDGARTQLTGISINEITAEFEYFATCICSDSTLEPDGTDGLRDLEVMQSIYQSSDRGMNITV